ncbi:MAG: molybdopterin-dependent oxidoreductase [Acidobacteria bacterium]|nr:molybdopterin-dependent oxidoreductase [Acidobacteriota bacterium]
MRNLIFVTVLCLLFASVALAQDIVVENGGKTITVTRAELTKLGRISLSLKDHGADANFEGVPLFEVLKLAGVEFGESLRGKRLTTFLLVEAADGYRVVIALPELDSSFTDKRVILADKRDGKPLTAKSGPWQIVVEGDKRAGRWVRQVIKLRILDAAK